AGNVSGIADTNSGGAIRFLANGTLTIRGCTLSGNSTGGKYASGGAVFVRFGALTILDSTFENNSTGTDPLRDPTTPSPGLEARGGALYAIGVPSQYGDPVAVTVTNSTLANNSTQGQNASGGAIHTRFSEVRLINSTLSGNATLVGTVTNAQNEVGPSKHSLGGAVFTYGAEAAVT